MYQKYKLLLQKNEITSYKVAKDTGIAQSSLSEWKSGRSKPKVDKLKILADYFQVSIDYFLSDETEQTEQEV